MLQIIIIILSVAADQLSKFFIVPLVENKESITVIPGVFNLHYAPNTGASFGMLQGFQVLFIIVTVIVLIVGAVLMVKTRHKQSLFLKVCLSLVIGGAIGNFIDRIFIGHVRDFLDFSQVYFPWVFNIADMCLVIGAILLGVYVIFFYKTKNAKAKDVGTDLTEETEEKKE